MFGLFFLKNSLTSNLISHLSSINKTPVMKKIIFFSFLIAIVVSCNNNDDNASSCDLDTIVSANLFASGPDDNVTINSVTIDGNCLTINFSFSGCDGNLDEVLLIDADEILESIPVHRRLRLAVDNQDLCLAFFTKDLTFDISNLQTDASEIQLNIEGLDTPVMYKY